MATCLSAIVNSTLSIRVDRRRALLQDAYAPHLNVDFAPHGSRTPKQRRWSFYGDDDGLPVKLALRRALLRCQLLVEISN